MKLRFSDPEEFLNELRRSPPDAEPVLRVTVRHQLDPATRVFRHLTVIATYLRTLDHPSSPVPLAVTLESYQGEDWGSGWETSTHTHRRTGELLSKLRAAAGELGLECRPGVYEPEEGDR